jgi:hypothetical protein
VKHAYHFFRIFQGLIVDIIFSFQEREESRLFFQKRDSEDAFKVLAIELNFFYELLYTKVIVLYSMLGYSARCISWCAVVAAISTFYSIDKNDFGKIDVGITYSLLFGAMSNDKTPSQPTDADQEAIPLMYVFKPPILSSPVQHRGLSPFLQESVLKLYTSLWIIPPLRNDLAAKSMSKGVRRLIIL